MSIRAVEVFEWRCESCDLVDLEYDQSDAENALYEHQDEYHD